MPLAPGNVLGHYEIIEKAGAGGMGEVFKARDTRLDRTVAIKVLPASVASNSDFKLRFEREAKTISSLNHPNICTLYDIGEEDGLSYLVMEYIEGETLSDRIKRGACPMDQLLPIASQIADALDKAHVQGLVHRDLKPANVMITSSGAKLLDFGLAKLQIRDGQVEGVSAITQTTPLTGTGTILGTLQYMSPEQLEGKEADARSDIFAFGALLYEMATGKRAFEGQSNANMIAGILEREPVSMIATNPMIPPTFERLVKKCLNKNPESRWQSARDLADELRWVSQAGSLAGIPFQASARRRVNMRIGWGLTALFFVTTSLLAYVHFTQPQPESRLSRLSIVPQFKTDELSSVGWARISPDGNLVAFQGTDTLGGTKIWIRPLSSLESFPLRGTDDAKRHFWSPDSKYLAFFRGNQLFKMPVEGGSPQLICEAPRGSDGTWGKSGNIIFDGQAFDTLEVVSASGGEPVVIDNLDSSRGEIGSSWPWFLSDGEHFSFVAHSSSRRCFKVGALGSSETKVILDYDEMVRIESRIEYSPEGYFLYIKGNILVAHEFDIDNLELVGQPRPVAQRIERAGNTSNFGTSNNGTLLYQHRAGSESAELVWFDRSGNRLEVIGEPNLYQDMFLSPDDSKLVYGLIDPLTDNHDLWIRDLTEEASSRFTFDQHNAGFPIWSWDGKTIAYARWTSDGLVNATIIRNADGSEVAQTLFSSDSIENGPVSFVPGDSSLIIAYRGNDWDFGTIGLTGADSITPLLNTQFEEWGGKVSPDGRLILYFSNESGLDELYIRELGASGVRWQVSNGSGSSPSWTKGGSEIIYRNRENQFVAVPITSDDGKIFVGAPETLFTQEMNISGVGYVNRFVVTSDGQKILINVPIHSDDPGEIIVVQNWTKELEAGSR